MHLQLTYISCRPVVSGVCWYIIISLFYLFFFRYSESLRIGHEYLMEVTSPELPNFIGQLGDESTLREFFEELKEALQFFGSDQPPNQSFRYFEALLYYSIPI